MTLRMPAETAPHEQTLMAWPTRRDLWGPHLDAAKHDYAVVAAAIARGEPVLMVARPDDVDDAARTCGPGVEVLALPIDDSWMRDTGPVIVTGAGRAVALDFEFNGWGGKFHPVDADDALASRLAAHLGIEHRRIPLVFEAGSITVDGRGTAITTEQCLLHPNRNPTMSRAEIAATLGAALGIDVLVWLRYGLVEDHDTDGHVDNVAAFVHPGLVAVQNQAAPGAPNSARLRANNAVLRDAGLDVVEFPLLPYARVGTWTGPVPYLNWYVADHAVVVPVTGHPDDAAVLDRVADLYGREAIGVPGAVIAYGGGGVHCITQQVPACPKVQTWT
jgi:agmatine deiminase